MNTTEPACPSMETLAQCLTDDSTPQGIRAGTIAHLESCVRCQAVLDQLTSAPEDLPPHVRARLAQESTSLDLAELRGRLHQIPAKALDNAKRSQRPLPRLGLPERAGELGMLGPYPILALLGRGGMGVVYLARHPELGHHIAVKVLLLDEAGAEARVRFLREARALAAVRHDHVVRILEVHNHAHVLAYLVMEYIEGPTLLTLIREQQRLEPGRAAEICRQIASGLSAVHATGLMHRDVKPGNILVETSTGRARIVDFGLVRLIDAANDLTREDLVGSPDYMSPEQVQGRHDLDARTDIYSVGVTLYQALTGEPPFRGTTAAVLEQIKHDDPTPPRKKNEKIPRDLEIICLKCLDKDRNKRYPNAVALAEDLRRFLACEPILARPVGPLGRLIRWAKRRPSVAGLSAAIVALIILSFTLVSWQWFESVERGEKLAQSLDKEQQARRDQQQTAYFDKIAAAHAAFHGDNVQEAVGLLEECPAELRDWEWRYLYRLCCGAPAVHRFDDRVRTRIRFRPDGKAYASTGHDELRLHDAATGDLIWKWSKNESTMQDLVWHPDGLWLAVTMRDKHVQLHDGKTGVPLKEFGGHEARIFALACCPKGRLLASGAANGKMIVWNAAEARVLHQFHEHKDMVTSLAFHPEGLQLASSSFDKTIKIWDVSTGTLIRTLPEHKQVVAGMAWSPCGEFIVSTSRVLDNRLGEEGTLAVFRASTGERVKELKYEKGHPVQVHFRPDGRQLMAVCPTGVRRWSMSELKELSPIRSREDVTDAVYDPEGARIVTLGAQNAVRFWDAEAGQNPVDARPSRHTSIFCMAMHPRKRIVACGDGRGTVEAIDLDTRTVIKTWRTDPTETVHAIAWSADGNRIAAGCAKKPVLLCAFDAPEPRVIQGHGHRVYGLAFVSNDQQLITASADKTARIWDVATGKERSRLSDTKDYLRAIAINPRARIIAVAEDEVGIRTWHLDTGTPQRVIQPAPINTVTCLAYSPDGKDLAAGGPSGASDIHIFDADSGAKKSLCRGHKWKVSSVAWSHDGKRLASSSEDGEVRIWEPRSGRVLLTLRGHKGCATAAAFTSDGKQLISTGWDGTVRIWDGTPVEP